MDLTSTNASEAIHPPVLMLQHGDKRVALQLVDSTRICGRLCYATQIKTLITCEHKIDSIRGGVKIENRENLGQCPKRGWVGNKKQKCPNFNLGILKTEGGGLFFSEMSKLPFKNFENRGGSPFFKNVPISII